MHLATYEAQPAGIGNCSSHLGISNPLHASLYNRHYISVNVWEINTRFRSYLPRIPRRWVSSVLNGIVAETHTDLDLVPETWPSRSAECENREL